MLSARELSYQNLPRDVQGRDADLDQRAPAVHARVRRGRGAREPHHARGAAGVLRQGHPAGGRQASLRITRPEIYYGEVANEYVFVRTRSQEFDYPAGRPERLHDLPGAGRRPARVPLAAAPALAIRFGAYKLLLSDDLTSESRVLFHRHIGERVQRIAPFFRFDPDPYLVIRADGRLVWLLDGYTATDRFPYAERVPGLGNYIRNAGQGDRGRLRRDACASTSRTRRIR